MTKYSLPIVGAHFRPPAKSILNVLPGGTALKLVPEPTNAYDPNACAVYVESANIPVSVHDDLAIAVEGQGYTLEEILEYPAWHLGYIPRTAAETLAPQISEPLDGTLGFNMEGKPTIIMEIDNG